MLSKSHNARLTLCLIFLGLVVTAPAFCGSAVIGSVAGSMNATVGGQTLLPNTTLFSGDSLQVKEGVAVIAVGNTSRMVFGHNTLASFQRESNEVTVLLDQGDVSLFNAESSMPVRVKVGNVSVVPLAGIKTLGEVAMVNGTAVITAKEGSLRVEGDGPAINVIKGKTITVNTKASAPAGGGNPPSGKHVSSDTLWVGAAAGLAGGALVVGAVALSRAGTASDNASSAASEAAAAASNAAAATSAADSAASAAAAAANSVGCALNVLAAQEGQPISPYTPPAGQTCP